MATKKPILDFGRALRLLAARDDRTQLEIAKAIGIQSSYVSLLTTGRRKNPSSEVLRKLAGYFSCQVSDIMSLAEGRGGVFFR